MHQFWGWVVHHCYTDVCSVACAVQQLCTVEPYSFISPTRMLIHRYASFCNAPFSKMLIEKFMIHLTQLGTVLSSHVKWSTGMLNSLHVNKYVTSTLLNPNQKYPSTLTWKHKASFQSLCINFRGELSTIATLMFAMLHVLLNSLCTVEPCLVISPKRMSIHRYASLCNAPFSRRASLKSVWYI